MFFRINFANKKYLRQATIFWCVTKKLVGAMVNIAFVDNQAVIHIIHPHNFIKHAVICGIHFDFALFKTRIIIF